MIGDTNMSYYKRTTVAGKTIEVEKYYNNNHKKKGIKRGDKVKPTTEGQKKINSRNSERKLRQLLNANFEEGDIHLILDYIRVEGEPDRTAEEMRHDIDIFLRECRKEYRKAGLEFRYVHVMEIGERGARHHHLVVNRIATEILQKCWNKAYKKQNKIKAFNLDNSGNYAKLASYLVKYTDKHRKKEDGALQKKRWNASKNLKRPEPEIKVISERDFFRTEPKPIKGYYVDKGSVCVGIHSPEYYGYGFLRYIMVRLNSNNKKTLKSQETIEAGEQYDKWKS